MARKAKSAVLLRISGNEDKELRRGRKTTVALPLKDLMTENRNTRARRAVRLVGKGLVSDGNLWLTIEAR